MATIDDLFEQLVSLAELHRESPLRLEALENDQRTDSLLRTAAGLLCDGAPFHAVRHAVEVEAEFRKSTLDLRAKLVIAALEMVCDDCRATVIRRRLENLLDSY